MKQLWFFVCACVILALGCSEMVPGTCYENPAGGAGGGGSIPSTSAGATSGTGDFLVDHEKLPQDATDPEYPENEPQNSSNPPAGCDVQTNVKCGRASPAECSRRCLREAAVSCYPHKAHPYPLERPGAGTGNLYACGDWPDRRCWYRYRNGDRCVSFPGTSRPMKCDYRLDDDPFPED